MRSGITTNAWLGVCQPSAVVGFRLVQFSSVTQRQSLFALSLFIALKARREGGNEIL